MPQVVFGTTAQFLMFETAPVHPAQGMLPKLAGELAPRWQDFHKEVLARPVEARVVDCR